MSSSSWIGFRRLCLLAVCWSVVQAGAWAVPWKVVPGDSVGPIRLGAQYVEANKHLTPHEAIGSTAQGYLRYKEGIELECVNQKITQIVINKSVFTAPSGPVEVAMDGNLRIGASVAQMESALGRGYEARDLKVAKSQPPETYYAYKSRGLGVLVRAGKVVQFAIWPRK